MVARPGLGSYLDVSMITSLIIYPACQKVRYHYLMAAQQHWLITPRDGGSGRVGDPGRHYQWCLPTHPGIKTLNIAHRFLNLLLDNNPSHP